MELVLSLPFLAMIMCLLIIVGTAGAWKVRTLANSRHAVFRAVWPRTGDSDARPANWWPSSASMRYGGASPSPFTDDPFAAHCVVRGPFVAAPAAGRPLRVIDDTLDMTQGLHTGHARIDRDLPVFRQLPTRNRYRRDTHVFSGQQWQHGNMGISNDARRILVTYDYDLAEFADPSRMLAARDALLGNPDRPALAVLDRDDELRSWYGDPYTPYDFADQYGRLSVYPFAAHCSLEVCACSSDLERHVDRLLGEIENVPRDLAHLFLRMYQEQLAAAQNMNPPPPNIGDLQQKIQQLQDFLATLP